MKTTMIKNFLFAILLTFMIFGSFFYFSNKIGDLEERLANCKQQNITTGNEAKSRRGNFDYKRPSDGSDKLTY